MSKGGVFWILLLLMYAVTCWTEATPTTVMSEEEVTDNALVTQRTSKLIRGSTRSVMLEIARELISRTARNSQVLSLSATNLIILLVLKALLLGAGIFSLGLWRRSEDENYVRSFRADAGRGISESEILLILAYLMGDTVDNEGGYDCMNRVACEDPYKAKEYLSASKMILKGLKLLSGVISYNPKYDYIVYGLQEAVEFGQDGKECAVKYKCSKET